MTVDANVLEQFDALAALGSEGRARMAPMLKSNRYRAGSQLVREGDEGDACYLLAAGEVDVIKNLPDGRKVKLATLPAGTLFGQAGLIPGQTRTADVRAVGNIEVLSLERATLEWALGRGEAWAVAVQALVAVGLVKQLRSALERLGELARAEDASAEITGRKRSEIQEAKSLNASFDGLRAKGTGSAPVTSPTASVGAVATIDEEAIDEAPNEGSVGGLLELLRTTEEALASSGFDANAVEFVFDEDQMRTAEARR